MNIGGKNFAKEKINYTNNIHCEFIGCFSSKCSR